MTEFRDELSLLYCLLINAAVFGCAWLFARRRMTTSRSQALLDAALLGYAVQYLAVGLPGLLHCLNFMWVSVVAISLSVGLVAAAGKPVPTISTPLPRRDRFMLLGTFLFTVTFVLQFAHKQADLPVISNDGMTYHFPAAVQWLQHGRIDLYQTWFFNPSNTYSPLAGSIFILWLILPSGSDVLARFVEIPALLCTGLAVYRLCNEVGARRAVAAPIAAAVVLCCPLLLPGMMGKDDLFVVFFMVCALVGLSKHRALESGSPLRLGIAIGLLLAIKYTAFLCVPILIFAFDNRGWTVKKGLIAFAIGLALAGPWYVRNWLLTGNPVFPLQSLFTTARSQAFNSFPAAWTAVVDGSYGMPFLLVAVTIPASLISTFVGIKMPIVRACSIGSVLSVTIFFLGSPFPEVRFLLPVFCLMFVNTAFCIERIFPSSRNAITIAVGVLGISVATVFHGFFRSVTLPFAFIAMLSTAMGVGLMWWAENRRTRIHIIAAVASALVFGFTYVNWVGYCNYQRQTRFLQGAGYATEYPQLTQLWSFVESNVAADATVAYTNLYFVYPLQGTALGRNLVYAPTRAGVHSVADLGWLGNKLSGERLVPAAIRATFACADQAVWLTNLSKTGAKYLIIGKDNKVLPPETNFVQSNPKVFTLLFDGDCGQVYKINR